MSRNLEEDNIKKSWIHICVSLLLLSMVVVQYNDPDPYLWMTLYGLVTLVPLLYYFGFPLFYFIILLTIVLTIFWLSYLPELVSWLQAGSPSLVDEMKTEDPTIELVRELGGLTICLITLIYYLIKIKSAK
jgi:hypothetical protein